MIARHPAATSLAFALARHAAAAPLAFAVVLFGGALGCGGSTRPPAAPDPVIAHQPPPAVAEAPPPAERPPLRAPDEPDDDDDDDLAPLPPPPPIVQTPAPPTVKLLSRGKGKRAPLRYGPAPGYRCEVAVEISTVGTVGALTMTVPTVVMRWTGDPITVTGDVFTTHDTFAPPALRDVGTSTLPSDALEGMRDALASLGGTTRDATTTTRGILQTSTLTATRALDLGIIDSLQTTSPGLVFPLEAVGVGARWQVDHDTAEQSVKTRYQTVYELVRRTGPVAVIRATVTLRGASYATSPLPIKTTGTGTGELTFAGTACPAATTTTTTEVTSAGTQMTMTVRTIVTPGLAPATVAP